MKRCVSCNCTILLKLTHAQRGYKSPRHEMADQLHPPSQIYAAIAGLDRCKSVHHKFYTSISVR